MEAHELDLLENIFGGSISSSPEYFSDTQVVGERDLNFREPPPFINPFAVDNPPKILKCPVCDSVMITEGIEYYDRWQSIRFRCVKNCRGTDLVQTRDNPSFPPESSFNLEESRRIAKEKRESMRHLRTLICLWCGKEVTNFFYDNEETCSPECRRKQHLRFSGRAHQEAKLRLVQSSAQIRGVP